MPIQYQYRASILYNLLNQFTFVGMQEVPCFHLTRFTSDKIYRLLPLLYLHKIRFRNCFEAISEVVFAVIHVHLSYPTHY